MRHTPCTAVGDKGALRMWRAPCAAVRDEGALRMRRAPCGYCGCAPYGEGGFDVFFIRAKHTKVIHHSLLALSLTGY